MTTTTVVSYLWGLCLSPPLTSFQSIQFPSLCWGTEAGNEVYVVPTWWHSQFSRFDVTNQCMSKTISVHARGDGKKGHVVQCVEEVRRVLRGGTKDQGK